jgi:hypothetical protein
MRGEIGGYLSFGGLPPVGAANADFAPARMETVTNINGSESFVYYTSTPKALGRKGLMLATN